MIDHRHLIRVLREELILQTRHCQLLEAQQRALLACDRPRFCALQEDHAKLLLLLQAQQETLQTALQDADGAPQTLSVLREQIPPVHRRYLDGLRSSLRRTLERTQQLNRQNRQLIENELEYFAFTLDLFVEAGRKTETGYGGSGWFRGNLGLDRCA